MAKLSARGRAELARMVKKTTHSGPYHPGEYSPDYKTELVKSNEVEWKIRTVALMSDGVILTKEKWKHYHHEQPFNTGWKVVGKLKNGMNTIDFIRLKEGQGYTKE